MQVVGNKGIQGQGPFMTLYFEVTDDGIVEKAWFETYGCPSAIRCGDWVAKWAVGRPLHSLGVMEAEDLIVVVGGLPMGKEFCATMTVEALSNALCDTD